MKIVLSWVYHQKKKSMCSKHDAHGEIGTRWGQEENQKTDKAVVYRLWIGFRF